MEVQVSQTLTCAVAEYCCCDLGHVGNGGAGCGFDSEGAQGGSDDAVQVFGFGG